jgi:hypothetical protein
MISTAILTASYAVCQPESVPRTVAPSLGVPRVPLNAELTERAMEVDETASALGSRRDASCCISSVGVESGISADNFDLRKRGIARVDARVVGGFERVTAGTEAPGLWRVSLSAQSAISGSHQWATIQKPTVLLRLTQRGWFMTKKIRVNLRGGGLDDDDPTVSDGDPSDNDDSHPRCGTRPGTSYKTRSDLRDLEPFDARFATSQVLENSSSKFYLPGTASTIDDINSNLAADPG